MIIKLCFNKKSQDKYFENYEELVIFLQKIIEVRQKEKNIFNIRIYFGEEEKRIREIISKGAKK